MARAVCMIAAQQCAMCWKLRILLYIPVEKFGKLTLYYPHIPHVSAKQTHKTEYQAPKLPTRSTADQQQGDGFVRNFAQYAHLRWGFRTPKWEPKSGAENYFPSDFDLANWRITRMLATYGLSASFEVRTRTGSSFPPHFCAPIWVSETPT